MQSGQGSCHSQLAMANTRFRSPDVLWANFLLLGIRARLCASGRPLHKLTRKNIPFEWDEDCKNEAEEMADLHSHPSGTM